MTPDAESYEYDIESSEFFDEAAFSDEATRRSGRPIFAPGGFTSATLQTPRGPAKLNLPGTVAELTQLRKVETAVNANTRRLNTVQADLNRVRRELALRRRDQQGQGTSTLLFTLLSQSQFRKQFESHTHNVGGITTGGSTVVTSAPSAASASTNSFSSFLPLLLLQPGIFGGSQGSASTGSQDSFMGMSPILMLFLFQELFNR